MAQTVAKTHHKTATKPTTPTTPIGTHHKTIAKTHLNLSDDHHPNNPTTTNPQPTASTHRHNQPQPTAQTHSLNQLQPTAQTHGLNQLQPTTQTHGLNQPQPPISTNPNHRRTHHHQILHRQTHDPLVVIETH